MSPLSREEAITYLRQQPGGQNFIRDCYYDDPLLEAAQRFAAGEEWREVRKFLPKAKGSAIDIGAGRGISSFALASDGWEVTALEPDPSALIGAGAIRSLAGSQRLGIKVVEGGAEVLPFKNDSFDLIYGRQILHHAKDMGLVCREAARVLKPGGRFLATREHVIDGPEGLKTFLGGHAVHRLCGDEHAFLLREYVSAISSGGLKLLKILRPLESAINRVDGFLRGSFRGPK